MNAELWGSQKPRSAWGSRSALEGFMLRLSFSSIVAQSLSYKVHKTRRTKKDGSETAPVSCPLGEASSRCSVFCCFVLFIIGQRSSSSSHPTPCAEAVLNSHSLGPLRIEPRGHSSYSADLCNGWPTTKTPASFSWNSRLRCRGKRT